MTTHISPALEQHMLFSSLKQHTVQNKNTQLESNHIVTINSDQ